MNFLRHWATLIGAGIATLISISLIGLDIWQKGQLELHGLMKALALILIGLSYTALCYTVCRGMDRYHWRLTMGITFILWGTEYLLPTGLSRVIVGDVVVFLFILDLVLIFLENLPPSLAKAKNNSAL